MRSAKSVAWIRLNVVGVNISFFLPRRVVCRTSGEEFHSLKATAYPCDRSQWLNRESCVDLPEPSIPSTTINLPRYRFGTKRGIHEGALPILTPGWPGDSNLSLICN